MPHRSCKKTKMKKAVPWNPYEIAIQIEQENPPLTRPTKLNDLEKTADSETVSFIGKSMEFLTGKQTQAKKDEVMEMRVRLDTLENQYNELKSSLQKCTKDISEFHKEIVKRDSDKQNQILQFQALLINTEKTLEAKMKTITDSIQHVSNEAKLKNEKKVDYASTKKGSGGSKAEGGGERVLRNRTIPTTKSCFPSMENHEESSEEEEEENESDYDEHFEASLDAWEDRDTGNRNHNEEVRSLKENEKDRMEIQGEGIHSTLHQIIECLMSSKYTDHDELDVIVDELSNMTKLEYPDKTVFPDVSVRQALFLKQITCFYKIVCVVSNESDCSCEDIYANADLLQQVIDRVQAML